MSHTQPHLGFLIPWVWLRRDQEWDGAERTLFTPVQLQRKLKQKQLEGAFSHKLPKHLESHISESGWGEKEETVSLGAHICYPLKKISEK